MIPKRSAEIWVCTSWEATKTWFIKKQCSRLLQGKHCTYTENFARENIKFKTNWLKLSLTNHILETKNVKMGYNCNISITLSWSKCRLPWHECSHISTSMPLTCSPALSFHPSLQVLAFMGVLAAKFPSKGTLSYPMHDTGTQKTLLVYGRG